MYLLSKVREYLFSIKVVHDWNSLNEEIVSSNSLNRFNSGLMKFYLQKQFALNRNMASKLDSSAVRPAEN